MKLQNCHPFIRELWGQAWVFAHNGDLKDFNPPLQGDFLPIGETDSELAFCLLLQTLKNAFGYRTASNRPTLDEVDAALRPVCSRIATYALPVPAGVADYIARVHALPGVKAWVDGALAEKDFLDFEEPYRLHR